MEIRHLIILENTGLEAALDFASRSADIYRACLIGKGKSHAKLPQYRRGFVDSYLTWRRFIREHN